MLELHPKYGANPHIVESLCPACGAAHYTGIALLGIHNYVDDCPHCGVKIVGGKPMHQQCPACKKGSGERFSRHNLSEFDKITVGSKFCKQCSEWRKHGIIMVGVAALPGEKFQKGYCKHCHNITFRLVNGEKPPEECDECHREPLQWYAPVTASNTVNARTGRLCVMKHAAFEEKIASQTPPEVAEEMRQSGVVFVSEAQWHHYGFPTHAFDEIGETSTPEVSCGTDSTERTPAGPPSPDDPAPVQ